MKVPQLSQSCCGCTLEQGSLVIGWLGVIGGILALINSLIQLLGANSQHASTTGNLIYAISALVSILFSVILIVGVKRRLRNYVQIWVILSTIGLIINILTILITAFGVLGSDPGLAIGVIITGLIMAGIGAYLILVVYSFYREMGNENPSV